MDSHPKWRLRARAALETYFRNRSYPRFILALLVAVSGFAGFLLSCFCFTMDGRKWLSATRSQSSEAMPPSSSN